MAPQHPNPAYQPKASDKLPKLIPGSTYHSVIGPGAYLITFTCYGTWLPGDDRTFIDSDHNHPEEPRLAPDAKRLATASHQLKHPPIVFNATQRECVLTTILSVCDHRGWWAHAVHVRTNHVHAVISAAVAPEKVMGDFKSYATRELRRGRLISQDVNPIWTEHGSTRYLWNDVQFAGAMRYVRDEQGERVAYGEGPVPADITEPRA